MQASDRQITSFTTLGHALFHTYELSIPLFIGLWITEFGLSAALTGLVVGAGYALIGIGAPVSGVLSDYFGSRRLILLSVLGMGGGFALLGAAQGPLSLAACVVLWGAFASLYHPAGLSLISRGPPNEERCLPITVLAAISGRQLDRSVQLSCYRCFTGA